MLPYRVKRIKKKIDAFSRDRSYARQIRKLKNDTLHSLSDPNVIAAISYGWGNEVWSASNEFLACAIDILVQSDGPVLECGSGLSTILLGLAAQELGREVWSLESDRDWFELVSKRLQGADIHSVKLQYCPIARFGEFDWYEVDNKNLPVDIGGVVCDGPPGEARGGRFGLVPMMKSNFSSNVAILLDDTQREEEMKILQEWCEILDGKSETFESQRKFGTQRKFSIIRV